MMRVRNFGVLSYPIVPSLWHLAWGFSRPDTVVPRMALPNQLAKGKMNCSMKYCGASL
jgi:hypothetical protein